MLTGRPPFGGSTQEVIQAVRSKEAPDVRIVNPIIEPHLAHVVQKAMAKDPADRYASADEMLRELGGRRAKAGRVATKVAEVRREAEQKASRRRDRSWLKVALAAAGVLAVLVLSAGTGWAAYHLAGAADDDAPPPPTRSTPAVASGSTGACESYVQAACACPQAEGSCEAARARVTALRGAGGDPTHDVAVEGWCRISLEAGEACRVAGSDRSAPSPTPLAADVDEHGGALGQGSWRRADGSLADRYSLPLRGGEGVEIGMQGATLDAHLLLFSPTGRIVGAADAPRGSRAKVAYVPTETGVYVLEAGAEPGQQGRYVLSFEPASRPRASSGWDRPRAPRPRRPPASPSAGPVGGGRVIEPWGP
jgi:hypothetical protein